MTQHKSTQPYSSIATQNIAVEALAFLQQNGVDAIVDLTADSRLVKAGSLFLAYPGAQSDGRDYIPKAIASGAVAVLWESESLTEATSFTWQAAWQLPNKPISNLKQHAGEIAAAFYGNPSAHMQVVGVTGTNGKTSVSQWIAQCLATLNSATDKKVAVLGTIGNGIVFTENNAKKSAYEKPLSQPATLAATNNTTPDAIVLQRLLADYLAQGVSAVAMEVSSHGLDQHRVNGMKFDVAVFTNLTRDHLDYHGDMASYGKAKQALFDWPSLKIAVVNTDDAFGRSLAAHLTAQDKPCMTYGFDEINTAKSLRIQASDLRMSASGMQMQVATPQGNATLQANVIGRFNADNLLAVLGSLLALNVPLKDAVAAIATIQPVAGRMQQLGGGDLPLVVVDYAHTPDALEKALTTLKATLTNDAKLICVFGCGGNRDAGKRPLMGNIAATHADFVVLTNDNPRFENAADILSAIQSGMQTLNMTQYCIEENRDLAIALAISKAKTGDIVLIAGKGHEDYQEVTGVKTPFSDMAVAREKLNVFSQAHFSNNKGVTQ